MTRQLGPTPQTLIKGALREMYLGRWQPKPLETEYKVYSNLALQNLDLSKTRFIGCRFDLSSLDRSDLIGSELTNCTFRGASLIGVDLTNTRISDCDFDHANLSNAKLNNGYFVRCTFEKSVMPATLSTARFQDCFPTELNNYPQQTKRNPRSSGAIMVRVRRNPNPTFTLFHADHGITPSQMDFIQATLVNEAPQGFFIKELMLPQRLGVARNALYGPAAGDPPVSESSVVYRPRGDRPWADRVVSWPTRPTNRIQAIGVREGDNFKLITVYGGFLAPQHPEDPSNPNVEAARKFWSQHALSIEQWDEPGAAKRNPRSSGTIMTRTRRNSGQDPRYEAFRAKGGNLSYATWAQMMKIAVPMTATQAATQAPAPALTSLQPSQEAKDFSRKVWSPDLERALAGDKNLYRANLKDADLSGANLSNARLIDADLRGANLKDADLSGTILTKADFGGTNLKGANLHGAFLHGTRLVNANLGGANLSGANLSGADLTGANLIGADFTGARFANANLAYADLSGTNLKDADLTYANFYKAHLSGADLSGANLKGVILENIIGLDKAKRNPFFVSPKGSALKVSDPDFAARKFPRYFEREVEIEAFDPSALPTGFSIKQNGVKYCIFYKGQDTGLYAMEPRKAAEIIHRKKAMFQ